MKKSWLLLFVGGLMIVSCSQQSTNPFFETYTTPFLLALTLVTISGYLLSCALGGLLAAWVIRSLPPVESTKA